MGRTFPDYSDRSKFNPKTNFDKILTARGMPVLSSEDDEEQEIFDDKYQKFYDIIAGDDGFIREPEVVINTGKNLLSLTGNAIVNNGDVYELDKGTDVSPSIFIEEADALNIYVCKNIIGHVGPFNNDVHIMLYCAVRRTSNITKLGFFIYKYDDDGNVKKLYNVVDNDNNIGTSDRNYFLMSAEILPDNNRYFYIFARSNSNFLTYVYDFNGVTVTNKGWTRFGYCASSDIFTNTSGAKGKQMVHLKDDLFLINNNGSTMIQSSDSAGLSVQLIRYNSSTFNFTHVSSIKLRTEYNNGFGLTFYKVSDDMVIGMGMSGTTAIDNNVADIEGYVFKIASDNTIEVSSVDIRGMLYGGDSDMVANTLFKHPPYMIPLSNNRLLCSATGHHVAKDKYYIFLFVIFYDTDAYTAYCVKEDFVGSIPDPLQNAPPGIDVGNTILMKLIRTPRYPTLHAASTPNSGWIMYSQIYDNTAENANFWGIKFMVEDDNTIVMNDRRLISAYNSESHLESYNLMDSLNFLNEQIGRILHFWDDDSFTMIYPVNRFFTEYYTTSYQYEVAALKYDSNGGKPPATGVNYNYANDTSGYLICEVFKRLITKDDDIYINGIMHDIGGGHASTVTNYLVDPYLGDESTRRVQKCVRMRMVNSLGNFSGMGVNSVETNAQYAQITDDGMVYMCEGSNLGTIDDICYAYVIGHVDFEYEIFTPVYRHIRSRINKGMEFDLLIRASLFNEGQQEIHVDGIRKDDFLKYTVNYTNDPVINKDILSSWNSINRITAKDNALVFDCFSAFPKIDITVHFRII